MALNIVEASLAELQDAMTSGRITSVDLVAAYLRRIAVYDCRGPALNSIPIISNDVFAQAAASDDRRRAGEPPRTLEGIPYTIKDSYRAKGQTAASGSPAFKDMVSDNDAFTVAAIREHGGVLLGRTNMPPMAYGGMQRGVYGRAESPYNPKFLAAAWSSGSSNGSAVSTAASFAAFGMGEETVSSGRSPASNNALVAYTPSRGWISIRGNWPLYPTCDVVVPHTRSMDDMLALLETITRVDAVTEGDFWRDQPWIKLAAPWGGKQEPSLKPLAATTDLKGLRIAVPHMYIGGDAPAGATPVHTSAAVVALWEEAREQLEALGAEVIVVPDLPAVTAYEHPELLPEGCPRLPAKWPWVERGPLVAHAWHTFLKQTGDKTLPDLLSVPDEHNIFPNAMRTEAELRNLPMDNQIHWGKLADYIRAVDSIWKTEHLEEALNTLETMRKVLLEDYLAKVGADCVVFPSQGDIADEDADVDFAKADFAWKNGVWYSNGNRSLRHLGIPSVTVPMGNVADKQMPVGLTFAGPAYSDEKLLAWANAFEKKTARRTRPAHTPSLPSDELPALPAAKAPRPALRVAEVSGALLPAEDAVRVEVSGDVVLPPAVAAAGALPVLEIAVQGVSVPAEQVTVEACGAGRFGFRAWALASRPAEFDARQKTMVPVARDKTMVVVLARSAEGGYPAGHMTLV